jgi:hypothetical protein
MARVRGSDVKCIITTTKTSEQIEPFITAANLMVSDVLSGSGQSSALLKEIERWLSAHFVAIDDGSARRKSEEIGDASAEYEGKTDMGLKFTRYGQQVLLMDTSGLFAQVGMKGAEIKTIA